MSFFYTYIWLRTKDKTFFAGTPRYVGKGTGYRAYQSMPGHRPPAREFIRIQHWPDEATAYAYERYLIDFYGRIDLGTGCLRNKTDGGDAPPKGSWRKGLACSPEHRRKIGEKAEGNTRRRGSTHTPIAIQRQVAAKLGKKASLATRLKMSASHKNSLLSQRHMQLLNSRAEA